MSMKFDFSTKLDFNDIDLTAPNMVVEEIASQIAESTNNIIHGTVAPYSGHVFSYTQKGGLGSLSIALGTEDKRIDIQTTLGRQGEEKHKYEFFLQTPSYKSYKFRVCYLQHGISNYPVTVVLEQSIANSMCSDGNASYIFKCKDRADLEDLVVKVIYSKPVIGVMQELIRINQIKKDIPHDEEPESEEGSCEELVDEEAE